MTALAWSGALPLATALFLGFGTLVGLRYVARPLALLVVAIAIAEALTPVVNRLARLLPFGLALGLTYAVLAAATAGIGWLIVPTLVEQGQELVLRAPEIAGRVRDWTARSDQAFGISISALFASLPARLSGFLVMLPLRIAGVALDALLVGFLSAYWIIGWPALERFVLSLLPEHRRDRAEETVRQMREAMGGYVRGAAINAVIMGALAWGGLSLIGVPYALTLGALTMLLEPIPFLGPILAGVPVVAVAFLQSPQLALFAVGLYTALQQVEGSLLTPVIMRRQTDMPQTLVIFALIAGAAIGGVLGVLAAIPAAAALRVLVLRVVAPWIRRSTGATDRREPSAAADRRDGSVDQPDGVSPSRS